MDRKLEYDGRRQQSHLVPEGHVVIALDRFGQKQQQAAGHADRGPEPQQWFRGARHLGDGLRAHGGVEQPQVEHQRGAEQQRQSE